MTYRAEHVRFTLECDACGLVERRELAADEEAKGLEGWGDVRVLQSAAFCCPSCIAEVSIVLTRKERAELAAKEARQRTCLHFYVQRGFSQQCANCGAWK